MAIQTATTGNLDNAQRIAIAECRYTMEHNQPCVELIEHMTLKKGEKTITVPKVAQMTAKDLVDGVDLVDTADIGMTTLDLTTAEVGLKVILTDKLVRQENEDPFKIVGRQMGDAMGRKKNRDTIALYAALNGATTLGADDKLLTMQNLQACISWATSNKLPAPVYIVHHPNAVAQCANDAAKAFGTYPMPVGLSAERLGNFYRVTVNGVAVFQTGDIDKIGAVDSGYGAIFSKAAMCVVESLGFTTKRQEDISLRATEVVVLADYGLFELDDLYGAPMRYEIGALSTSN